MEIEQWVIIYLTKPMNCNDIAQARLARRAWQFKVLHITKSRSDTRPRSGVACNVAWAALTLHLHYLQKSLRLSFN
jgi:hypothetical protein